MKILIRTSEIVSCYETNDACIIETLQGKSWVCKKFFEAEDGNIWNTLWFIASMVQRVFITLELKQKGKSDNYGEE